MQKRSDQPFMWMPFTEHPHKDYIKESILDYDVTTKEFSDAPSDYIIDGSFNQELYCRSLIRSIFNLPQKKLANFLDYQCGRVVDPKRWMVQLDLLLNNNYDHDMVRPYLSKLNLMIQLIEDKSNDYTAYVFNKQRLAMQVKLRDINRLRKQFDIIEVKLELEKKETLQSKIKFLNRCRIDYLQEVEKNEAADFIGSIDMEIEYLKRYDKVEVIHESYKKIKTSLTPAELSDYISHHFLAKTEQSKNCFDASVTDYARLICDRYCKMNGSEFSETSIRRTLTSIKNGERTMRRNFFLDIEKD